MDKQNLTQTRAYDAQYWSYLTIALKACTALINSFGTSERRSQLRSYLGRTKQSVLVSVCSNLLVYSTGESQAEQADQCTELPGWRL
jgi:hypothetical protein